MRAVVLVGGFGTRLRPLTLGTPKQMLPVVDRPMIEWVMAHLATAGITDAVLSLGYRPDAFTGAYAGGTCAGVGMHYAVEPEPLDTAGAIRFAARDAGIDERFVVVNGDVLTDVDIAAVWRFHDEVGAEATIHLTPVDDPSRYGVVPIDDRGRVQAFVEKPPPGEAPSHWINAGTYVVEPTVLDRIPDGRKVSIERETFPALVADRSLYAVQTDDYWIDAGTPETYLQCQLDLVAGRRPERPPAIATDVRVAADATVADSVLMAEVRVDGGARVRQSVVLPGAHICRDAVVERSVVGPGAVVGERARLAELTVVGQQQVVEDGFELVGARVPEASS